MNKTNQTLEASSEPLVTAFVVMLVISLACFFVDRQPIAADPFLQGVQSGFSEMGLSKSIIGAFLFLLIAALKPSRWTLAASACLLAITIRHWMNYAGDYDNWGAALIELSPVLFHALLLSPTTWAEYFVAYRALRTRNDERFGAM